MIDGDLKRKIFQTHCVSDVLSEVYSGLYSKIKSSTIDYFDYYIFGFGFEHVCGFGFGFSVPSSVVYSDYAVRTVTTTTRRATIMMRVNGNQLVAFGSSDYVTK